MTRGVSVQVGVSVGTTVGMCRSLESRLRCDRRPKKMERPDTVLLCRHVLKGAIR